MSVLGLFKKEEAVFNQFGDKIKVIASDATEERCDVKVLSLAFGSPHVHGEIYNEESKKLSQYSPQTHPSADPAQGANQEDVQDKYKLKWNPSLINKNKNRPTNPNLLDQPEGSYFLPRGETGEDQYHIGDARESRYELKEDEENIFRVYDKHEAVMLREAFIRKKGDEWCVFSESKTKSGDHKNLGCYPTEAEAKKRLGQVEYFKAKGVLLGSNRHYVREPIEVKNLGSATIQEMRVDGTYLIEYNDTGQYDVIEEKDLVETVKDPVNVMEKKAQGDKWRKEVLDSGVQVADDIEGLQSDLGDDRVNPARHKKSEKDGTETVKTAQHNSTDSTDVKILLDKGDDDTNALTEDEKPYQPSRTKLYSEVLPSEEDDEIGDEYDNNYLSTKSDLKLDPVSPVRKKIEEKIAQTHSRVNDEVGREKAKEKLELDVGQTDQDYVRDFDKAKQEKDEVEKTKAFKGHGNDNPGVGHGISDVITERPSEEEREKAGPKMYNSLIKPLKNNGNDYDDGQETDKGPDRMTSSYHRTSRGWEVKPDFRLSVEAVSKYSERFAERMKKLGYSYVEKELFERKYSQYIENVATDLPGEDVVEPEEEVVLGDDGAPEITGEDITESSVSDALVRAPKDEFDAMDVLGWMVNKTITEDAIVSTYKRVVDNIEVTLDQFVGSGLIDKTPIGYALTPAFKSEYGMPSEEAEVIGGEEIPDTYTPPIGQEVMAAKLAMSMSSFKKFAQKVNPGVKVKFLIKDKAPKRGKVEKVDYQNDDICVLCEQDKDSTWDGKLKHFTFKEFNNAIKRGEIELDRGKDLYGMKKNAICKLSIDTNGMTLCDYNKLLHNLTINDAKQFFDDTSKKIIISSGEAGNFGAIRSYVDANIDNKKVKSEVTDKEQNPYY